MPNAAPRPCPVPGCPELTDGGRCPAHRRTRNASVDARRGSPILGIESNAVPEVRLPQATSVRDIFAHCDEAPIGDDIDVRVNVDGEEYAVVSIADGTTTPATVADAKDLPAIPADTPGHDRHARRGFDVSGPAAGGTRAVLNFTAVYPATPCAWR